MDSFGFRSLSDNTTASPARLSDKVSMAFNPPPPAAEMNTITPATEFSLLPEVETSNAPMAWENATSTYSPIPTTPGEIHAIDTAQDIMTTMDDASIFASHPFHGGTSGELAKLINETPLPDMNYLAGELAAHTRPTGELGAPQTALGQTFNLLAGPDFDQALTRFTAGGLEQPIDVANAYEKGRENAFFAMGRTAADIIQQPGAVLQGVAETAMTNFGVVVNHAYGHHPVTQVFNPEGTTTSRAYVKAFVSNEIEKTIQGVKQYTDAGLGHVLHGSIAEHFFGSVTLASAAPALGQVANQAIRTGVKTVKTIPDAFKPTISFADSLHKAAGKLTNSLDNNLLVPASLTKMNVLPEGQGILGVHSSDTTKWPHITRDDLGILLSTGGRHKDVYQFGSGAAVGILKTESHEDGDLAYGDKADRDLVEGIQLFLDERDALKKATDEYGIRTLPFKGFGLYGGIRPAIFYQLGAASSQDVLVKDYQTGIVRYRIDPAYKGRFDQVTLDELRETRKILAQEKLYTGDTQFIFVPDKDGIFHTLLSDIQHIGPYTSPQQGKSIANAKGLYEAGLRYIDNLDEGIRFATYNSYYIPHNEN